MPLNILVKTDIEITRVSGSSLVAPDRRLVRGAADAALEPLSRRDLSAQQSHVMADFCGFREVSGGTCGHWGDYVLHC